MIPVRHLKPHVTLSVCIPTLDVVGSLCQECIRAVKATLVDENYDLVVIDNGSCARGVTEPINAALRAARGKYIAVINDDVIVQPGWWLPLKDALDAGATVALPFNEREGFSFCVFAITCATLARYSHADGEFFDPQFMLWCQDTDFRIRVKQADDEIAHVKQSHIVHIGAQSCDIDNATIARQVAKDRARLYLKQGVSV